MFKIVYNYFNQSGEQEQKQIERKTLRGLINATKRHLESNELYQVVGVSPNLVDFDFEKALK